MSRRTPWAFPFLLVAVLAIAAGASPAAAGECGDGVVDPDEQCDDGNTNDGDCCSSTCTFEVAGSPCSDGFWCTVGEACDGKGNCAGAVPRDCGDGIACTVDTCSETRAACVHTPNDAACSDGHFCDGAETCSATLGCRPGTLVSCDDGDVCTNDACNDAAGRCDHVYDPANDPSCPAKYCGNGRLDAGEQCDDGNKADGDCCSSACRFESAGSPCSNGRFCTVGETCNGAGACLGGTGRDCGDGIACTVDACDAAHAQCVHAPNDAACNDGVFCNGAEVCDPTLGCRPGAPVNCDDGDVCTDDSCNEAQDRCDHVFDRGNDPACAIRCPDADGDGYSAIPTGCGPVDCDDTDPAVHPGAVEICDNDRDDNCDGKIDAADAACGGKPQFSVRRGPISNPAFAGSPACEPCHKPQYDTWSRTLHARMLIRPGDAQAAGFALPDSGSIPGTPVSVRSWSDVLFVVGQKWKTHYVARDGRLEPARWNFALGQWSADPGGAYDCGACHTTGFDRAATFLNAKGEAVPGIAGAWVEYNIGCEACHGPGAEHTRVPSRDNINRIVLDWTRTGDGIRTPGIRSSEVCGNCHYRGRRTATVDAELHGEAQFNQWMASPHASTLEPTTLSTYCAKCHSPGNATADSEEHHFTYFDAADATQVACVSCHDPHATSDARWADLAWPADGRQDPLDHPAAVARYRGTDGDVATADYTPIPAGDTNELCADCHRIEPGLRRHVDASPPETVTLHPPDNFGNDLGVPHAQHVANGVACVTCHMAYTRNLSNPEDVRSHALVPDEQSLGGRIHYNRVCGQCHAEASTCILCHAEFGRTPKKADAARAKLLDSAGRPRAGASRGFGKSR